MAIQNANMLQQNIDFELLSKLNNKYLLDSLANLGQRLGVKGTGVKYHNLVFNEAFPINSDYFTFEYVKNGTITSAIMHTYDLSTRTYTNYDVDESQINSKYIYNKFTLNKYTFNQNFGFELYNDIQKYYEEASYIQIIDDAHIAFYLFGDSVKNNDGHIIYEHFVYNTTTNTIDEYNRLMFLYNDNVENIYILLHFENGYFDYVLFKYNVGNATINNTFLQKSTIQASNNNENIISYVDIVENIKNGNFDSVIIIDNTLDINENNKIKIEFNNEKNRYYSIENNAVKERCNTLLSYIGLDITKFLNFMNNDLVYLIPNCVNYLSKILFTQNIETFTFRVLCKLYEAILNISGIGESQLSKENGILYIPKDAIITYLCNDNNIFEPYISKAINVEFIDRVPTADDETGIYYQYSDNAELGGVITENKLVDMVFSGYYNNGYLLNINFNYTVYPYIGEDLLWYINNRQTDIQTNINDKYFLEFVIFDISSDEEITVSSDGFTIINTEFKQIYDSHLAGNIELPVVEFTTNDDRHNYAIIGKTVQTVYNTEKTLYFIYSIEYNNTTYVASPLLIGDGDSKSILLLEDLFNYDDSLTLKTLNEIEEKGFNEKLNINNKFNILNLDPDYAKSVLVTNNTGNFEFNKSSDDPLTRLYTSTYTISDNNVEFNINDSGSVAKLRTYNKLDMSSAYTEYKSSVLLEISEYLLHNLKILNKLGIFSFDNEKKYLDYIGINRISGKSNELILKPMDNVNKYIIDRAVDDDYAAHDTIRINYKNIINDGIPYIKQYNPNASENIDYYSFSFDLSGYLNNILLTDLINNITFEEIKNDSSLSNLFLNNNAEFIVNRIYNVDAEVEQETTNDVYDINNDSNTATQTDANTGTQTGVQTNVNTPANIYINSVPNDTAKEISNVDYNYLSGQIIINLSNILSYLSVTDNYVMYYRGVPILTKGIESAETTYKELPTFMLSSKYFYIIPLSPDQQTNIHGIINRLNVPSSKTNDLFIQSNIHVNVIKKENTSDSNANVKYYIYINSNI